MKATTSTQINKDFNTVESIYNQNTSDINAYLEAMDIFEIQATQFSDNESFFARMCAKEVSLAYDKAKKSTEPYEIYTLANAAEKWLQQAVERAN
jgi:hypothetical protein